jgi:hypothetical protein
MRRIASTAIALNAIHDPRTRQLLVNHDIAGVGGC